MMKKSRTSQNSSLAAIRRTKLTNQHLHDPEPSYGAYDKVLIGQLVGRVPIFSPGKRKHHPVRQRPYKRNNTRWQEAAASPAIV